MQLRAKFYISGVLAAGFVCLTHTLAAMQCSDPFRYVCYLCVALLASVLKITLPGIPGTMSVSYVFVLLTMLEFSYAETMLLACLAITFQYAWNHKKRLKLVHFTFNLASMALAVAVGYSIFQLLAVRGKTPLLNIALAATG